MKEQTHRITNKDAIGSTCTNACGSTYTEFYNASMIVQKNTCLYIYTKDTGVHGGTSTDVSTENTVLKRRTNVYEN